MTGIPTTFRVQRVSELMGGHLIITVTHPSFPDGSGAVCPTGNTIDELRASLQKMIAALDDPIMEWPVSSKTKGDDHVGR